jgi:hypothetical protein
MKNVSVSKLCSSLLMGVLAIGASASASHAVAQGTAVNVDVPFAFQNGSQHLPAGTYRIDLDSEHLMILRGATPDAAGFVMTNPEQRSSSNSIDKGKVVFHKYADHYYLRAVWIPGNDIGRKCVMSNAEKREKQLQFARNSTTPSNVEIALNTSAR